MRLTINLSPAQADRLRHQAELLRIAPEDLARAALADLLATRDEDLWSARRSILERPSLASERPTFLITVHPPFPTMPWPLTSGRWRELLRGSRKRRRRLAPHPRADETGAAPGLSGAWPALARPSRL